MRSLTPLRGVQVISRSSGTHAIRIRQFGSEQEKPITAALPPRWLSDVKSRIGKCISFGMDDAQRQEAIGILQVVARDWRELLAGSEGFLTDPGHRGLYRQAVVWGEMDSMHAGHVNNVMYNRYAESARVLWARNYATRIDPVHRKEWAALGTSKGLGMILRSIKTDFKFPMTFPDRISVYHKLVNEPGPETDSFRLEVLILSELHQRPAARCAEDIVMYDYKAARKAPLKPFMVNAFRETWSLQQKAARRNSERVHQLLERVRNLETCTWDRKDAVEHVGSKP